MHVTARIDYAIRAMLALATTPDIITAAALSNAHQLPLSFLHGILADLRRANLVYSMRGTDGGYRLARPATDITVGDIIRAADGTLLAIGGRHAGRADYTGAASHLGDLWNATEQAILNIVDETTLTQLIGGKLPLRAAS